MQGMVKFDMRLISLAAASSMHSNCPMRPNGGPHK